MQFTRLIFPILFMGLLFAGCSKEESLSETDRLAVEEASEDYLLAEKVFEDVFKTVDREAKQQGDLNGFQDAGDPVTPRDNCPAANLEATENDIFPAVLTLDFGAGCTNDQGVDLAGKIIATFNGLLLRPGTNISIAFDNFFHEGNAVTGTYQLSNDGEDANGQPTFTGVVDGLVTRADGRTIAYKSTRTTKQTEGNDTRFRTHGLAGILDDVWSSTRETTVTTGNGQVLRITTGEPVRSPLLCRWPVSGYLELQLNIPDASGTIDFGDGSCDNKALLTVGDYSREINL